MVQSQAIIIPSLSWWKIISIVITNSLILNIITLNTYISWHLQIIIDCDMSNTSEGEKHKQFKHVQNFYSNFAATCQMKEPRCPKNMSFISLNKLAVRFSFREKRTILQLFGYNGIYCGGDYIFHQIK